MDSKELRKAAELAGFTYHDSAIGPCYNTGFSVELAENPMLPAYVAALLVKKIKNLDSFGVEMIPREDDGVEWQCLIRHHSGATVWNQQ